MSVRLTHRPDGSYTYQQYTIKRVILEKGERGEGPYAWWDIHTESRRVTSKPNLTAVRNWLERRARA